MEKSSEDIILVNSSSWVAALLNFLPGLGTGYIYQRRWKAYWIANVLYTFWITYSIFRELKIDPSDPLVIEGDSYRFIGLFIISIFTSIESWFAVRSARSINKE